MNFRQPPFQHTSPPILVYGKAFLAVARAQNMGVILDSSSHIPHLRKPCWFYLQNGSRFSLLLITFTAATWSGTSVSRLDHPMVSKLVSSPLLYRLWFTPNSSLRQCSITLQAPSCHISTQNSSDASISQREKAQTLKVAYKALKNSSIPSSTPTVLLTASCSFSH